MNPKSKSRIPSHQRDSSPAAAGTTFNKAGTERHRACCSPKTEKANSVVPPPPPVPSAPPRSDKTSPSHAEKKVTCMSWLCRFSRRRFPGGALGDTGDTAGQAALTSLSQNLIRRLGDSHSQTPIRKRAKVICLHVRPKLQEAKKVRLLREEDNAIMSVRGPAWKDGALEPAIHCGRYGSGQGRYKAQDGRRSCVLVALWLRDRRRVEIDCHCMDA